MSHALNFFSFCPHCGSDKFNPHYPNSKKCGNCGFEFFKNPAAAVSCFVYDDKGRLMVFRRAKEPYKDTLDTPGGFIDVGETAEIAAIRELKEESNLDIEITKFLFTEPNVYEWTGYIVPTLDLFFECRIKDITKLKAEASEVSEILFIDPQDINITDFGLPSVKKALQRVLNKSP